MAAQAPVDTEDSNECKTELREDRLAPQFPSSNIVAAQAGTAVDEPVASDPPDTESSQIGSSGDRSGWPPKSRLRSKIGKFMDGLRARWRLGWSRVATFRSTPLARDT